MFTCSSNCESIIMPTLRLMDNVHNKTFRCNVLYRIRIIYIGTNIHAFVHSSNCVGAIADFFCHHCTKVKINLQRTFIVAIALTINMMMLMMMMIVISIIKHHWPSQNIKCIYMHIAKNKANTILKLKMA